MSFCVWKLEALQSNCNMCCSGNRLKRSPQRLMSPLSSSHSFLSCWFLAPLCPLLVLRSPASWRVMIYTHVSLSVVSSNTSVLLQSSQSSAVEEMALVFLEKLNICVRVWFEVVPLLLLIFLSIPRSSLMAIGSSSFTTHCYYRVTTKNYGMLNHYI